MYNLTVKSLDRRKKKSTSYDSSTANSSYHRTYEVIKIDDLEQVGESSNHILFNCPNCTEKRGEEYWSAGKLYWSVDKQIGLCYQCNTVFFPECPDDVDESEWALKNVLSNEMSVLSTTSYEDPEPIKFEFEVLDKHLLLYLKNRNPYLVTLIKSLGLQAWYGSKNGVVFPFIYKDNIVKCQARFDVPRHGSEDAYWTSPGRRLLYSPQHIFTNFKLIDENTVTLCEGVFDAVALTIMGYPNPLAILGGSITSYQLYQVRRLMPDYAFLAMDDENKNLEIRNALQKHVLSISDTQLTNFGDSDPEEYLRAKIRIDEEFKASCTENTVEWLNMTD